MQNLDIDLDALAHAWTLDFHSNLVTTAQDSTVHLGHGSSSKRLAVE